MEMAIKYINIEIENMGALQTVILVLQLQHSRVFEAARSLSSFLLHPPSLFLLCLYLSVFYIIYLSSLLAYMCICNFMNRNLEIK